MKQEDLAPTRYRTKIPASVADDVLTRSQRRCCLCFALKRDWEPKDGQIAHVDRDSSNHRIENLAWLCLEHHNEYDSRPSQARGMTAAELRVSRRRLYSHLGAYSQTYTITVKGFDLSPEAIQHVVAVLRVQDSESEIHVDASIQGSTVIVVSILGSSSVSLQRLSDSLARSDLYGEFAAVLDQTDIEKSRSLVTLAHETANQGEWEEAQRIYTRAIRYNPQCADAWAGLSRAHCGLALVSGPEFSDSMLRTAERCAYQALELDHGNPLMWVNVAVVREKQSELDEAEYLLDKALSIDPRCAHALYCKAVQQDNLGKHEVALKTLARVTAKPAMDEALLRRIEGLREAIQSKLAKRRGNA